MAEYKPWNAANWGIPLGTVIAIDDNLSVKKGFEKFKKEKYKRGKKQI